eukprot:982341-Amphidinium_carterae.1
MASKRRKLASSASRGDYVIKLPASSLGACATASVASHREGTTSIPTARNGLVHLVVVPRMGGCQSTVLLTVATQKAE